MEKYETMPWWTILVYGITSILLGVFLFVWPAATTFLIVWFIGLFWLMNGVLTFAGLAVNKNHMAWKVISGLLGVFVGGWIIITPFIDGRVGAAETTLAVLGATVFIWAIAGLIGGVSDLIAAFQGGGWGIGLLGAMWIFISLYLFANLFVAALVLPFVYGIFAIAGGIAAVVVAFRARGLEKSGAGATPAAA